MVLLVKVLHSCRLSAIKHWRVRCRAGLCATNILVVCKLLLTFNLYSKALCRRFSGLLLQGKPLAVDVVLELYQLLLEAGSQLRQPVALEEQLLKNKGWSSDVGKSMLQLLQVHYM